MSTIAPIENGEPASNASPPEWPGRVGAKTSKRSSRAGRTGVQARQELVNPCRSTIGSPVPPRWAGVVGIEADPKPFKVLSPKANS
jgi:hypothetical protein